MRGHLNIKFQQAPQIYLFSIQSTPAPKPIKPHIQWIFGYIFLGLKLMGREADHSLLSSAEG